MSSLPVTFYPMQIIWTATYLSKHWFLKKSLGCLMEYSLEFFKSLDQNGCNPIYGKTKYVLL